MLMNDWIFLDVVAGRNVLAPRDAPATVHRGHVRDPSTELRLAVPLLVAASSVILLLPSIFRLRRTPPRRTCSEERRKMPNAPEIEKKRESRENEKKYKAQKTRTTYCEPHERRRHFPVYAC